VLVRLGVLAAVLFWGVSFVATKAAVAELSPGALVFARAGLGTLVLVGILAVRRRPIVPPRESWGALALLGFVGVAFHGCLQAYALTMTSAISTGWLIGLTPVWAAVLSAWFLREPMGRVKLAGLVLGFLGAAVVVTRGRLGPELLGLPSTRGDLLILASTLNWAVYSVIGHATLRRLGPPRATAGAMAFGWVMLLPVFLSGSPLEAFRRLTPVGWTAVLFLGVACSGLGYLFWYAALERIEASRVASFLYLEPLVTLAAAAWLLGEPVRVVTLLGGLLLLAGVFLVQRAPGAAPRALEAPVRSGMSERAAKLQ
jgi:drug/metabolite transporter (DMT)-like permease